MSNRAWVTLATNDSYGLGALVLAHSLRRVGSAYPAVVLVTPALTDAMRDRLSAVFAEVITVDVLDSRDDAHLALLARPELGITFTKIHCWSLTQYEKCVFLDADTLVAQNCDELFEREELSAAPDVGWPDCFNSGVFVFKPSKETFDAIIKFAQERGSFDGGDQGLLNSYFSDWARGDINKHLPFLYNVTSAAFYSYLPAFKHFGQDLKIIHFIGVAKPWLQNFNWDTQSVDSPEHLKGCLQLWWDIFVSSVHTQLDANMTGVAGVLARVSGSGTTSSERGAAIDELTRRQGWEQGNIDYMGADSFDNIWAKISQTLNKSPPKEPSPPKEVKQPSPPKDQAPAPVHQEIPVVPVPVEKTAVVEQTPAPVESTQIPAPAEQIAAPVETSKTLVESTATAKETPVPKVESPDEQASEQSTPGPCKLVSESTPEEIEPSQPKESVVPSVIPVEEPKKATAVVPPTPPVTPKSTSESSTPVTESLPVVTSTVTPVTTKTPVVSSSNVSLETAVTASAVIPDVSPKSESVASQSTPVAPESLAKDKAASASPAVVAEAPVSPALEAVETAVPRVTTPEKSLDLSASTTDSPPLAHTPGKEDSSVTPAKSGGERGRKPAGKLMLSPPAAADALPTPDSELEDAASLAQSIIAGELAAPALASSPTPATPALPASPPAATEPEHLAAAATPLDTPPAGPVSLAQIGVKTKPSTAAQIESSLADPAPATPATTDPPKKKLVKKVVKKDTTAASGDAPVPPPRKKEKKPKEK